MPTGVEDRGPWRPDGDADAPSSLLARLAPVAGGFFGVEDMLVLGSSSLSESALEPPDSRALEPEMLKLWVQRCT